MAFTVTEEMCRNMLDRLDSDPVTLEDLLQEIVDRYTLVPKTSAAERRFVVTEEMCRNMLDRVYEGAEPMETLFQEVVTQYALCPLEVT